MEAKCGRRRRKVTTMVTGLKVTVDGTEARQLCLDRAGLLRAKANRAREQAVGIETAEVGAMNYTNGDPLRALKDKAVEYDAEAQELEFVGNHIDASETYMFDYSDMQKLGIVSRHRY